MTTGQAQWNEVDISIALNPNNIEAIPILLEELSAKVHNLNAGIDEDRKQLLRSCRSLVLALETPQETMIRHCRAETGAMAALNFGVDCGLWLLMAKSRDQPQKVNGLAKTLGVDPTLLSAMGYITETGEDEYRPTNYSQAMSIPEIANGYLAMWV
ncbi:uncharacterized protein G6M90_00g052260 [Metarhizium brunneum]|uniref:Uncharacterized protein n=1 Tax=Metarhizium brunneum TaxID=500148 RepID=A0A7D5YZX8_9HYPO|nr:hypothetical protein G6M90_00g052260 [Metarhizium brunneum]